MEITEVKVVLREGPDKKLKAYATLTLDNCFVVRNVKVIKGTKGLFVAMPSRKMRESCPRCNCKNAIRSKFCNQCGSNLPPHVIRDTAGEIKHSEHRDIAHPITLECREYIQNKVLDAYEKELGQFSPPGATEEQAPPERHEKPEKQERAEEPEKPEKKHIDAPAEETMPEGGAGDIQL